MMEHSINSVDAAYNNVNCMGRSGQDRKAKTTGCSVPFLVSRRSYEEEEWSIRSLDRLAQIHVPKDALISVYGFKVMAGLLESILRAQECPGLLLS